MKYITVMFPYPSGPAHIGHWYNYAIVDSYCRIQRYLGHEVFQPFGYDAFGLPAENAAKKLGMSPKEVTEKNISLFRSEIHRMNTEYKELLTTCMPFYQAFTQSLFISLKDQGLAYKSLREQDYCPGCETVLAREQVREGECDRCDSKVEKKELEQWFFKITDYKERLINDLNKVDYPEKTKKQQIHWLNNLTDWCVSRQRKWGCPIPLDGEEDTLDTFVDSSFYTIMYCIIVNKKPVPVDLYVGGNEHACMHLIYARFITKFLYDQKIIDFDEPFKKVIHQGMILKDGEKMSKSKGNVINPTDYDPQELRMYLMFINHYFEGGSWSDQNFKGVQRFIKKIYNWFDNSEDTDNDIIDLEFSKLEVNVINYFESWKTNKIVSEWMIFLNKVKNMTPGFEQSKKIKEFFELIFPR